ncbi:hypothetical protein EWM64_g5281 [Hericium alpestre]|uniref:Peptidase A1 domain-containing protein n=1 Tax=Hericium alpestre TaxID=135208 RepID=A0A4Y9ZXT8_9AGAM|nr:hypothetical protein EWM64_g5281 [Hericium alpestre]
MKGFTPFFTLVALVTAPSLASRLPLRRRDVLSSSDASVISISNFNNVIYVTNITIGGVEVPVQIDTGSTDLVVVPTAPLSSTVLVSDKVKNITEEYGTGLVSGPVLVAPFQWGSYSVEKQAFVNGTSVSAKFEKSLFPTGARGIFGLGFGRVNQTVVTTVFSALENDTMPA